MSYLEQSANCVIGLYPDARKLAVGQEGFFAVYFINGDYHGTRWMYPLGTELIKVFPVGDEVYRLKIFRERQSPMYKYPFYVLKP